MGKYIGLWHIQKCGLYLWYKSDRFKNRDINEVNLWRFDKEARRDVLKEMIKAEGYEESESTLENVFFKTL